MGLTRPRAAQIYNLDYKQATRVVTVSNVTLAGGAPSQVDGVNLSTNDRILVTAQSTVSQNGLYLVTTVGSGANGTWVRTNDGNETGEIDAGMIVMITEGVIYQDTQWKLITDNPININTTPLTFVQNYSANSLSGGTSNVTVYSNSTVNISSAGIANVLIIASTGTATTGNIGATGNISGNYILGNGSQLTGIAGGSSYSNANVISLLSAFGSNTISATGNVTAGYFIGNGSQLTGLPAGYTNANLATLGSNVISTTGTITSGNILGTNILTGGLISATGNVIGGNISATNHTGTTISITGTVTAASTVGGVITGSSTSVTGTINGTTLTGTSLTVSTGNITGGNLVLSGAIEDSGQLDIRTTASNGNIVLTPNGTGNINTGANVSVSGRVTAANVSVTGAVTAASTVGGIITGSSASVSGAVTGASLLVSAGNITGGNLILSGAIEDSAQLDIRTTASNGNIVLTPNGTGAIVVAKNIVNGQANGVGNIGSSTTYFNTIFAKATSAQYADLAEMYSADTVYAPGTVVEFGGKQEITISSCTHSTRVAGIISTNPSYLMNSAQEGEYMLPVALTGRVPCKVVGIIHKGDRLVAGSMPGVAITFDGQLYEPGCIIGKALEDYQSAEVGTIEVAVGRF